MLKEIQMHEEDCEKHDKLVARHEAAMERLEKYAEGKMCFLHVRVMNTKPRST